MYRNSQRGGQLRRNNGGMAGGRGRGRGRGNGGNTPKHVQIIGDANNTQWSNVERKRRRTNTGGGSVNVSRSDEMVSFNTLSVDEKLSKIMIKLFALDDLTDTVKTLKFRMDTTVNDITDIKADVKEFDLKLKTLEYKAIDQEARSRRNNLLFWGIPEDVNEDCEKAVLDIVHDGLGIASDKQIAIQRAHRVGKMRPRGKGTIKTGNIKPRPIVACFRDFKDIETILAVTYKLKESDIGVSRDYPKEIHEARRALWGKYKEAKKDSTKEVSLKFPAKLVINGIVVEDYFPNWMHFIRGGYMKGTLPMGGYGNAVAGSGLFATAMDTPADGTEDMGETVREETDDARLETPASGEEAADVGWDTDNTGGDTDADGQDTDGAEDTDATKDD